MNDDEQQPSDVLPDGDDASPLAAPVTSDNDEGVGGAPVMDELRLRGILESLLFVAGKPLEAAQLLHVVGEDVGADAIMHALYDLQTQYRDESRGFQLRQVSGAWQFRSNPEHADYIGRLVAAKPTKLSRAALEALAIIAYRQPITRMEIEDLRGVDSGGVLKLLLERKLVKVIGHKEEPGRPRLYGSTPYFLEFFGLGALRDLPPLRQFEELTAQSRQRLDAVLADGVKVQSRSGEAHRDGEEEGGESFAAGSVTPRPLAEELDASDAGDHGDDHG